MSDIHNIDAEQALLGCLMFENEALGRLDGAIASNDFYEPFHQRLFSAIVAKVRTSGLASPITLIDEFKGDPAFNDLGGKAYFARLVNKAPPAANAPDYASVIRQAARQRDAVRIASDIIASAAAGAAIDDALTELQNIRENNRPSNRFKLHFMDEIEVKPGEWLVKDLIPTAGYGFIAGPSGSGKSFLALDWALRLSSALAVMGREPAMAAGVVYIASEGEAGVRKRVKAWQSRYSCPDSAPFAMICGAPDLQRDEDVGAIVYASQKASQRFIRSGSKLSLVVIDTLSQSMPGANENDAADMSLVMSRVQRVAKDTGAFVLLIHHTGKDVERGMRGSSVLRAAADLYVEIAHKEGEAARVATVKKLKDGEDGERFAFDLESVNFKYLEYHLSSCVPSYHAATDVHAAAPTRGKTLNSWASLTFKAFGQLWDSETGRMPAPLEPGVKAGQQAILKARVKDCAQSNGLASEDEKEDTVRKRFDRAIADLVDAGKVRISGKLIWPL